MIRLAFAFLFLSAFASLASGGSRSRVVSRHKSFTQAYCLPTQHKCNDSSRCIPTAWLCDGDYDCSDNSDEEESACKTMKTCNSQEFMCANNQCIPARWHCDKEPDCSDGSDEKDCASQTCGPDEFPCGNGTGSCIPHQWRCDTQSDCADGSDEENCPPMQCLAHEWQCELSKRCIFPKWRCDNDYDCGDGPDGKTDTSDEDNCEHNTTCSVTEFTCKTGKHCVPQGWVCDGEKDCPDGSDEQDCKPRGVTCAGTFEWPCNDGKCIHKDWRCDDDPDCADGSDEMDCGHSCKTGEIPCKNVTGSGRRCVPSVNVCDGKAQCDDGSDELNCATTVPPVKCQSNQFDCGGRICVNNSQVCDGKVDCDGGIDEKPCDHKCTKKCPTPLMCTNLPWGAECRCEIGFKLAVNSKTCEDVDECSDDENRVCSQICNNTVGSYHCKCHENFVLESDGKTCRAIGDHPQLLVSNRVTVRKFDLVYRRYVPVVTDMDSAVAMDYVYETQTLIWSDVATEKIMMCHLYNDSTDSVLNATSCTDALVQNETQAPDGLAVDWIHRLLYWTDTGIDAIFVIQLDGEKHRTKLLNGSMDEPRAIGLDPSQGLIFWTDWGVKPKLERASMDGTHRVVIVNDKIAWPNGLAIDFLDQRVFWADAKLKTISSCDYDGGKRRLLVLNTDHLRHPFSLAVFQERLYWTDWDTEGVHSANKFNGGNVSLLIKGLYGPMTVKVYQEHTQPHFENKCSAHPCSHLCLPRAKERWFVDGPTTVVRKKNVPYTCVCPDPAHTLVDETSCELIGDSTAPGDDSDSEEVGDPLPVDAKYPGEGVMEKKSDSPPKQQGRMAATIIAILSSIAIVVALFGYGFYRRVTRSPGKGLMFDNPTYRPTTLPVDDHLPEMESIQYDHQYNPVNPYIMDGQLSFSNSMTEPLTKSFHDDV